jgi:hypothetical protein
VGQDIDFVVCRASLTTAIDKIETTVARALQAAPVLFSARGGRRL